MKYLKRLLIFLNIIPGFKLYNNEGIARYLTDYQWTCTLHPEFILSVVTNDCYHITLDFKHSFINDNNYKEYCVNEIKKFHVEKGKATDRDFLGYKKYEKIYDETSINFEIRAKAEFSCFIDQLIADYRLHHDKNSDI